MKIINSFILASAHILHRWPKIPRVNKVLLKLHLRLPANEATAMNTQYPSATKSRHNVFLTMRSTKARSLRTKRTAILQSLEWKKF